MGGAITVTLSLFYACVSLQPDAINTIFQTSQKSSLLRNAGLGSGSRERGKITGSFVFPKIHGGKKRKRKKRGESKGWTTVHA